MHNINYAIIKTHSGGTFMIELNQLKQLLIIEEEETLSKAAQVLFISQPALTRSMQKLEKELGVSLFNRKKNKITLNNNGKEAIKYAKKIINETNKMKNALIVFDETNKSFHIGSYAPAPLWPIEHLLKKHYPLSKHNSYLLDSEQELIDGLRDNIYSMIILHHPLLDDEYECFKIFDEHLYLSVPFNHPFASKETVTFQELDGTSILLRSKLGYWRTIKEKLIPHSMLLFQDDEYILEELIKSSTLPSFRTNISLLRYQDDEKRTYIPIIDKEANVTFYGVYKKENKKYFSKLKDEICDVDIKSI